MALVGGYIADKTQNEKGTIMAGLMIMASGYVLLSIPILATSSNITWLLPLTGFALVIIAFGTGLFKGNLQVMVGDLYNDPQYAAKRDSGFSFEYRFHIYTV